MFCEFDPQHSRFFRVGYCWRSIHRLFFLVAGSANSVANTKAVSLLHRVTELGKYIFGKQHNGYVMME